FFKGLVNPAYQVKREKEARASRFSILEKLAQKHGGRVGLIPFEEVERELGITKEINDMAPSGFYREIP
ncbi:MAG: hypothetical protein ACFFG0_42190, partial [Candidatus Thorarchaeota archaeon]